MNAHGKNAAILGAELRQHGTRFGFGIDSGLEVGQDLHVLAAGIGAIPAAVGFGGFDVFQAVLSHAARFD